MGLVPSWRQAIRFAEGRRVADERVSASYLPLVYR